MLAPSDHTWKEATVASSRRETSKTDLSYCIILLYDFIDYLWTAMYHIGPCILLYDFCCLTSS